MVSAAQAQRALKPPPPARARWLGRVDYLATWQAMREFTDSRGPDTADQLWCVEHFPVFTQGQRGRAEHVLEPGDIPIVASDRGGQVTYHGPGQLVLYPLLDLQRLGLGPRALVSRLEQAMIDCLAGYGLRAAARADAPGVYVNNAKIGSIGLRIRRACSYHGLSLNVAMDLEPFSRINPCGMQDLKMTQLSELGGPTDVRQVGRDLLSALAAQLGIQLPPNEETRSA